MARRSATSTLAFCTQTLWKAAGRAQGDTGRHLRVRVAPTERLLGTRHPTWPGHPQTQDLPDGHTDPHQGPYMRGPGVHMQTKMNRQALAGQSLWPKDTTQQQMCSEHIL